MKAFLSISCLALLFLCSCSAYKFPESTGIRSIPTTAVNRYFIDTLATSVYRCKIQAFKKDLNGSLVIKTLGRDKQRVALVSDFGQTVFDISILPDQYEAHYVMPDLDKKMLLNELSSLFRTLTQERHSQQALLFAAQQHWPVYQAENCYYQYKDRRLASITWVRGNKTRAEIHFEGLAGKRPKHIVVEHKRFPLTIDLVLDLKQSLN